MLSYKTLYECQLFLTQILHQLVFMKYVQLIFGVGYALWASRIVAEDLLSLARSGDLPVVEVRVRSLPRHCHAIATSCLATSTSLSGGCHVMPRHVHVTVPLIDTPTPHLSRWFSA